MSDTEAPRRPIRLLVSDVMTSDVVTVSADTSFKQIDQLMDEHHISAVPVVDADGHVIGVVSEADLLLKTEAAAQEPRPWTHDSRERRSKAHAETAAGLMSSPAVTVAPSLPLAAAARLMRKQSVKRLPVVEGDSLVGIVSRADLLKSYLRSDADIASDVAEHVLRASMWVDPKPFDIEVDDGVVRVRGELDRRSDMEILITLTLGVEGVVGIDPTLTFRFDDRHVAPPKELGGI